MIFLWPSCNDVNVIKLMDMFGHVSDLRTNLAKSSAIPIHCSDEDLQHTSEILAYTVKEFPCTYLGFLLAIRNVSKTELLPV